MSDDRVAAIHATYDCRPGDVLILRKFESDRRDLPRLCKAAGVSRDHQTSHELTLRTLPFESRCLVVRNNGLGWAYVLIEGTLGWISHTDVYRLERA